MKMLTPTCIVPDRIFTHPQHTIYDRRVLKYMLSQICLQLANKHIKPRTSIQKEEADGRTHRMLLVRPETLKEAKFISLVGFFGQRQVGTANEGLQSRDALLVELMVDQDGLLSYTTLELTCGNFANCVLFTSEEAKNRWGANPLHQEIAHDLSPRFYDSVRIYNGSIEGGITDPAGLSLARVKYFDYRSRPVWRAQRELKG
ncbi:MAG: hypothetical protein QNJ45_22630 [Ardenticatenaceae bacterium]|nr:hypothetical protein [Ardenticatenaceae bacterium]